MPKGAIVVEGVAELVRDLNRAGGRELTKNMGRANKAIGQIVISRLAPLPEFSGAGAGARVRPSANARAVQLRSGGAHRDKPPFSQWGARYVPRSSPRPYILGTAKRVFPNIAQAYMEGIELALTGFDFTK